jgi:DNA-binding CsgD family transcriptional regulator
MTGHDLIRTCLLGSRCPCADFSPRERQVFHLLLSGAGEKQAALALGLSHNTLHGHAKRIYQTLNVGGRIELMAWALETATNRGVARFQEPGVNQPARTHEVRLTARERSQLRAGPKDGHLPAREARRRRILIESDRGRKDREIAAAVGVSVRTVERVRREFLTHGMEAAIGRRPQPPRPARRVLNAGAEARLVFLATNPPPDGHRRWTFALLARSMVRLGCASSISCDTVRRALAACRNPANISLRLSGNQIDPDK